MKGSATRGRKAHFIKRTFSSRLSLPLVSKVSGDEEPLRQDFLEQIFCQEGRTLYSTNVNHYEAQSLNRYQIFPTQMNLEYINILEESSKSRRNLDKGTESKRPLPLLPKELNSILNFFIFHSTNATSLESLERIPQFPSWVYSVLWTVPSGWD